MLALPFHIHHYITLLNTEKEMVDKMVKVVNSVFLICLGVLSVQVSLLSFK